MRLWSLHPKELDRQGLLAVWREGLLARKVLAGETRGYRFDRARIGTSERAATAISVTTGQLRFEARHLRAKLAERAPETLARRTVAPVPPPHPLFRVRPGPVADWERGGAAHAPPRTS